MSIYLFIFICLATLCLFVGALSLLPLKVIIDRHVLFAILLCFLVVFVVVQSISHVQLFVTSWIVACQAPLSFTISKSLLRFTSIELVMLSNHLILCCHLLLLLSIFPSIRVFSIELALCIRWPQYLSFSFSLSPFNECSGLTSFWIDWLDLLAVQGTLKSLLQHHISQVSTVLSLIATLASIHDYWKNHSFHYAELCQ